MLALGAVMVAKAVAVPSPMTRIPSLLLPIVPVVVIPLPVMAAQLEVPASASARFTWPLVKTTLTLGCSAVASARAVKLLLTFRVPALIVLPMTFAAKVPSASASTLTAPMFTRPTLAAVASVYALA